MSGNSEAPEGRDVDLEVIRKRCKAATRGPWVAFVPITSDVVAVNFGAPGSNETVVNWPGFDSDGVRDTAKRRANARFIAHAREDIPALIAEVERLRALRGAPLDVEAAAAEIIAAIWDHPRDNFADRVRAILEKHGARP